MTADGFPLWLLFAALVAGAGLALEGGYRFGRRRQAGTGAEKEAPVGAMAAAILGLFAFLLAFTFGMAAARFEARRQAVLDEANAVGTTYLRARLLPEPQRTTSAALLREYVDVRVRGARDGNVAEAFARSEELHGRLWADAVAAAEARPGPVTALYIEALNATIDLHSARKQVAVRSRIPAVIWAGLLALGALAVATVGYQSGLAATRRSPAMAALVLAFAGVLYMIADLDHPREGFLRVGQAAMTDLQESMKTGPG